MIFEISASPILKNPSGCNASYIGGTKYSLRANAENLSVEEIKEACDYAHNLGKKVYVTVNIAFHNEDYEGLVDYLKNTKEYPLLNIKRIAHK